MSNHETNIKELLENLFQALRDKEAVRTVECYTTVVLFSLAPPLALTADSEAGDIQKWFDTFDGPLGIEVRDLSVTAAEEVAFAHCLNRLTGTKVTGEPNDIWFRSTFGLVRVHGEWKIAHEHQSVPFYMDGSYKAAIDLKPE
ncbi:DUF4440 domain-containing protein [bacterium]|nr:MAG: DUF4440 domain-containing protein [bacterium]